MSHFTDALDQLIASSDPTIVPPPAELTQSSLAELDRLIQADSVDLPLPVAVQRPQLDAAREGFLTATAPSLEHAAAEQRGEEQSRLLSTLGFIADVTGLKSTFEAFTTLPIVGEPARNAFEKVTGRKVGEATTGDFIVAGITLFGGLGIKGALTLARGAVKSAAAPVIGAGETAIKRAVVEGAGVAGSRLAAEGAVKSGAVTLDDIQRAIATATEAARKGEIIKDPQVKGVVGRVFEKLGKSFEVGELEPDILPRIMRDYGINDPVEGARLFAEILRQAASESGRTLGKLSEFKKALAAMLTPEQRAAAGLGDVLVNDSVFRRIRGTTLNVWRAAITSQLGTAMRNLEVGLIRMPLQFFDDIASGAVKAFSGQTQWRTAFRPAVENLTAVWRGLKPGNKKRIEELLERTAPFDLDRLYRTPVFDVIETAPKSKNAGARVLNFLHLANRTQEHFMRTIAFDAKLSGRLAEMGLSVDDVFRVGLKNFRGPQRKAIADAITAAVDHGLDVTFALAPKKNVFMAVYRQFPEAALFHPFPRFLANSLRFLRDHSPFGVMKYATPSQRRLLAKTLGEAAEREAAEAIGKVAGGYVMFAGALALRNSDLAGERWYEIKTGKGIVDARPFNPLAAYMLLAEQMKRLDDPDAPGAPIEKGDYLEAFAGIRRLSGTGLFIFENINQNVDDFEQGLLDTARELVAGFTIPFRQFKDFLATFDEDEAVSRSGDESGFFGPAVENLPFFGRALPPAARPTREEPFGVEGRVGPLAAATARQLTGAAARSRTPVESKLIELDINPFPRTGDDRLNRLIAEEMGPQVERRLDRLVRSASFQRLDRVEQRKRLSAALSKIKSSAKRRVWREERRRIVDDLLSELSNRSFESVKEELRRKRNAGAINASIEREVLTQLRRRR